MSNFWVKKMKTYFNYLDRDKDGVVSKKDFENLADCFYDDKTDPAVREKARCFFVEVFRKYKSSDGSDDNGLLTAKILTDSVKQLRNDSKFLELFKATIEGFFKLIDLDEDGYIQVDEYARMFTTVGMRDLDFVKPAFNSIDQNHDGKISLDECCNAFTEFLTTDDEKSPYKLMYGHLV